MSDVQYSNRKLVCIEYPGLFRSADKMLETLGGHQTVSKVYSEPSRRLELRFRPQDTYCKCAHGDRFNTTNLLLKVKKHRKLVNNGGTKCKEEVEYTMEILGVVDTTYKFRGMMDFQYLPMERTTEKNYKSFASEIIPRGLQMSSWLNSPAPLFVLPVMFSRMDMPTNYHYRKEPAKRNEPKDSKTQKANPAIIGKGRQSRAGYAVSVNYDDPVPDKPKKDAITHLKPKLANSPLLRNIRKAFEERPIWSKSALAVVLETEYTLLKQVLPVVAYYSLTGPWRTLWLRFGYDPRKTAEAKIYQLIDFRVRETPGEEIEICPKRSSCFYTLPNKTSTTQARIPVIQTEDLAQQSLDSEARMKVAKKEEKELIYIFKPDRLPAYRQNFYQLCDIHIPEIQQLIHSNDGSETECVEKGGWLKPGTMDQCREIMVQCLRETLKKQREKEKLSKGLGSLPATMDETSDSDANYIPSEDDED